MINPIWHAGLPQTMEVTGYGEELPDEFVETNFEKGPPRRDHLKKGGEAEIIKGAIWANQAERAALRIFYRDSCLGGTLAFDWVHPIDGTAVTMEFMKGGLKAGAKSSIYYEYKLSLRILP